MSNKTRVLNHLQALSIPCEVYEHPAVFTMEECLALPYAAPDVTFCKNILLCNRQQTAFYLYVTLPDKPFRTADTSKLLHSSRLSFAPSECLPPMLGLESGSLSPLGQRPLWGLGQRPNCFASNLLKGSRQQRCRQRSVPASNFAHPQMRPQAALPATYTLSRQMGATTQLVLQT